MAQHKHNKRFLKCLPASMAIVSIIYLMQVTGSVAQRPTYSYYTGYGSFSDSYYDGSIYSEPISFWGPVLGSILPHPNSLPPPGTTLPPPGTPIPREIMNLGFSSNYDTSKEFTRLTTPYFLSEIIAGWSPEGFIPPYYNWIGRLLQGPPFYYKLGVRYPWDYYR